MLVCAFYNDFSESFSTINPSIGRPKGYLALDAGQLVFYPPSFSMFYRLAQYSYVLGLADLGLGKISAVYENAQRSPHGVLSAQERTATFKQIYFSAAELCREHGAEFVLVYLPFHGQYAKAVIQQTMDDLAATQGIKTLDLMDTMRLANRVQPAYFEHDIHFNEYGNQVAAQAMSEYLVKNGLLGSTTAQAAK